MDQAPSGAFRPFMGLPPPPYIPLLQPLTFTVSPPTIGPSTRTWAIYRLKPPWLELIPCFTLARVFLSKVALHDTHCKSRELNCWRWTHNTRPEWPDRNSVLLKALDPFMGASISCGALRPPPPRIPPPLPSPTLAHTLYLSLCPLSR